MHCWPPDQPRTRRAARPPAALQTTTDDADRRQTTDASEQNNTGPLGGPVIMPASMLVWTTNLHNWCRHLGRC